MFSLQVFYLNVGAAWLHPHRAQPNAASYQLRRISCCDPRELTIPRAETGKTIGQVRIRSCIVNRCLVKDDTRWNRA